MAELSKDLIGKKLKTYTHTIERGKIKEFCQAIGETNPIYLDPEAAKAAGYDDTPIPPTFQTSFSFWGYGYDKFWTDLEEMGIDTKRLLHMKEDYTYLKPLYPGNTITAEGGIVNVRVGKVNIVTLGSTYTNEKGEPCIKAEMSIIIPPEEK